MVHGVPGAYRQKYLAGENPDEWAAEVEVVNKILTTGGSNPKSYRPMVLACKAATSWHSSITKITLRMQSGYWNVQEVVTAVMEKQAQVEIKYGPAPRTGLERSVQQLLDEIRTHPAASSSA